jgi:hypothetical protein
MYWHRTGGKHGATRCGRNTSCKGGGKLVGQGVLAPGMMLLCNLRLMGKIWPCRLVLVVVAFTMQGLTALFLRAVPTTVRIG